MFNNKGSTPNKGQTSVDKRHDFDNNNGSLEKLNEKLVKFMLSSNESQQQLEFKLRQLELQLRNQIMENETLKTEIHALHTKNVVLSQKVGEFSLLGSKFESMCYDNKILSNDISKLKDVVMDFQTKGNNDIVEHVDKVQQAFLSEIKILTESIETAYDHRCKSLECLIRKISMKESSKNSYGNSSRGFDNAADIQVYSEVEDLDSIKNDDYEKPFLGKTLEKPRVFLSPDNKVNTFKPKGDSSENKETKFPNTFSLNMTGNACTTTPNIQPIPAFRSTDAKHNLFGNSNTEIKNSVFGVNKPIVFGESSSLFGSNKSSLFSNNKNEEKSSNMLFSTKSSETISSQIGNTLFSKPNIHGNNMSGTVKEKNSTDKVTLSNQSKETDSRPIFGSGSNIPSFSSLSVNADKGFGKAAETKWPSGSKLFSKSQSKEEGDSVKDDEFNEHDPEFKPIIELPPLIEIVRDDDQKSVLFKNRCKLYRFANGEWKERGVGDMKILKSITDDSVTLVMRREQIHKLCCNQRVTRDNPNLTAMGNDKSACWVAADFSEGESSMEKFAIKFSDKTLMDEFSRVINDVKSSL